MAALCKSCHERPALTGSDHCSRCTAQSRNRIPASSSSTRSGAQPSTSASLASGSDFICLLKRCGKSTPNSYCKASHAAEAVKRGEAVACAFCQTFPINPGFAFCSKECGRHAQAVQRPIRRWASRAVRRETHPPNLPLRPVTQRAGTTRISPESSSGVAPAASSSGGGSGPSHRITYQPCGCTLFTQVFPPPLECPVCLSSQATARTMSLDETTLTSSVDISARPANAGDIVTVHQQLGGLSITPQDRAASPLGSNHLGHAAGSISYLQGLAGQSYDDAPPAYQEQAVSTSSVALRPPIGGPLVPPWWRRNPDHARPTPGPVQGDIGDVATGEKTAETAQSTARTIAREGGHQSRPSPALPSLSFQDQAEDEATDSAAGPSTGEALVPSHSLSRDARPSRTIDFGNPSRLYYGFTNQSPLSVKYKQKTYITADHLFHAMKFLDHRPLLAEHIRECSKPQEEANRFPHEWRADWADVCMVKMDEVLEAKFKQHIALKSLLRGTGDALLVLSSEDPFWGKQASGEGQNELGKALMRLREKLLSPRLIRGRLRL